MSAAGAAGAGAWLELAVEADVEAVEAVSEILGRAASGGTSVEPAFELVDEGLGARLDPSRPAIVRAYLPARDRAAAERAAGEVGPRGGPPGSLYVAVHVQPHKSLTREGTELYYMASISIAQAALGTRITVPTVDGTEEVEIKPGTQPDTEIKLRGKGVPHLRRAGQRGDLHVMIDVVVPTKLSKKAKELLTAYAEETNEPVGHSGGLLEKLGL